MSLPMIASPNPVWYPSGLTQSLESVPGLSLGYRYRPGDDIDLSGYLASTGHPCSRLAAGHQNHTA